MKKRFSSAKEVFHYIVASLDIYDPREAGAIAFFILEYFGISKADVLSGKQEYFEHGEALHAMLDRLNEWEPLQYVLGCAHFFGRKFYVNPAVLIPRPETEELVDLILRENRNTSNLSILDIGTGSGCIAISLAKELENAQVFALDASAESLEVTAANAKSHNAHINCIHSDIFTESGDHLPVFDIIASNPPYVLESEKKKMRKNVTLFEPAQALFVSDSNPLLFYSRILDFSGTKLKPGGACYFEINEAFGEEVKGLMEAKGYKDVKIHNDMHDKSRFVSGRKTI